LLHSAQLLVTDPSQYLCRHLARVLRPVVVRVRVWKAYAVRHADSLEDGLRVLPQGLKVPDEVVADVARMTEPVCGSPVVVGRKAVPAARVRRRIEQVADHLMELNVVTVLEGSLGGVSSAHRAYNPASKATRVVASWFGELVAVGRDETVKRVTNEQELEVCSQSLLNLSHIIPQTTTPGTTTISCKG